MADISILSRLLNGIQRNVDLSTNTLVVNELKVGGSASTDILTQALVQKLSGLQSDGDGTFDSRYFTESEIGSTTASSGASLVGVNHSATNYTPGSANVEEHLSAIDTALASAGGTAFSDSVFRVQDNADATKEIAFEASGITAGNVRTITMPDTDVDLGQIATNESNISTNTSDIALKANTADVVLRDGSQALTADWDVGSFKITNLAAPTADSDAARKIDVDNSIAGIDSKEAVRVASTANIDLTTGGLLTIDGVTVADGDRVLVKDQTTASENGIYDASTGAWSRSSDFDGTPTSEVRGGALTYVTEGTANSDTSFRLSGTGELVVDTDALNWVVYSRAEATSAGDGLSKTGLTFAVVSSDLAGSGLEDDGSNNLRIAAAAAGDGLAGGGGSALSVAADTTGGANLATVVNVSANGVAVRIDDSTIGENASNQLELLDSAVTNAKVAAGAAIDFSKMAALTADRVAITDGSGVVTAATNATPTELENLRDGSNADSLHQHAQLVKTFVAGQSFAANTTHAVRIAITGETAGRVYAADYDASATDTFYAIGVIQPSGAVTAGDNVDVILSGEVSLLASDTAFAAGEIGQPVHLLGSGAWDAVSQITYTADQASYRIGMVLTTNSMLIGNMQLLGVA